MKRTCDRHARIKIDVHVMNSFLTFSIKISTYVYIYMQSNIFRKRKFIFIFNPEIPYIPLQSHIFKNYV